MAVKQLFLQDIDQKTSLQWITNPPILLQQPPSALLVCLEHGPACQASASLTTSGDSSC